MTSRPGAHRDEQRLHLVAERRLRLAEDALVVGPGLVEPGDDHRPRHPDQRALPPQRAGRDVDALVGGDHEQRAVGGAQPRAHLAHEVGVARGVEQVDLHPLVDQRRDRQRVGAAVPLLTGVVVAHRGAVVDRPGAGDGSGGGEQHLDQGGLAGATGPDQHDVPDPVRAARLEILPGWSARVPLVGHDATSTTKATPVRGRWQEPGSQSSHRPGNEPSPPLHGVSEGPGSTQSAPSATDAPESHGAASDVIICYRAVHRPVAAGARLTP